MNRLPWLALLLASCGQAPPAPRIRIEARVDPEALLPGDPVAGARTYALHCVACHGIDGDGRGAFADGIFPPLVRDHTDGGYMNVRSDQELFDAVRKGGPAVERSRLMPAFGETFDELETWNVVAYLRTLHPRIEGPFHHLDYHEVVLSPARRVGPARVVIHSLHDEFDAVLGYATYETVDVGRPIPMIVRVPPDLSGFEARTRDRIVPPGAADDAIDASLKGGPPVAGFERLREAAEATRERLARALGQEREDRATAERTLERFDLKPGQVGRGESLYLRNCMVCHGVGGRVTAFKRGYKPRNLADPDYMGRLTDEAIDAVLRQGGSPNNLSPAMPSFPGLSSADRKALLAYLRSLTQ